MVLLLLPGGHVDMPRYHIYYIANALNNNGQQLRIVPVTPQSNIIHKSQRVWRRGSVCWSSSCVVVVVGGLQPLDGKKNNSTFNDHLGKHQHAIMERLSSLQIGR
eukprot:scaffold370803_cov43-Prasinocladus_malaysianus.AAC.1